MRFTGIYSIVVGVLMLAQWVFFILTGQVPELQTEPIRIGLHLAAEAVTALALILSGIGLLTRQAWGRSAAIFSLGMLMYTVIVSPGYFAQHGVWPIVVMFAILLVLDLVSLRSLLKTRTVEAK
jgi:hypothetical protein